MSVFFAHDLDISVKNVSKMRMLDALFDLVEEKAFKDVTVSDICARAGVSRQTFYRHFASKFDAANWFWHEMATRYMMRVGRDMQWRESLGYLFENVADYLAFFAEAGKEGGFESVLSFGCRSRMDSLKTTVTDHLGLPLTEDLEFQIDFFAEGEARMVEELAKRGGPIDAAAIASRLETCVPRPLFHLLNDSVEKAVD